MVLAASIPNNITLPPPTVLPAVNVPATSIAPSPAVLSKANYPKVVWWTKKSYSKRCQDLGDHVVLKKSQRHSSDSTDDSTGEPIPSRKSKARSLDSDDEDSDLVGDEDGDESPTVLGFLEHENGRHFTSEETAFVRQSAQQEFQSYFAEQVAPLKWSERTSGIASRFRNNMIALIPALNLCSNHWKVDAVGTKVYAQWARYRKTEIAGYTKKPESSGRKRRRDKAVDKGSVPADGSRKRSRKNAPLDMTSLISMESEPPNSELADLQTPILATSFPPHPATITPVATAVAFDCESHEPVTEPPAFESHSFPNPDRESLESVPEPLTTESPSLPNPGHIAVPNTGVRAESRTPASSPIVISGAAPPSLQDAPRSLAAN
ncbi:hypothetical protein C8R45DRAFT_1095411 [Mycena sanguinolenta]|nr:hypothetical protein C8R45DRAFT_1095411 [Mycena sanguinolenta]